MNRRQMKMLEARRAAGNLVFDDEFIVDGMICTKHAVTGDVIVVCAAGAEAIAEQQKRERAS